MTEKFAERILRLRRAMGLTQEDFARRMGVTATTVSRWERGEKVPSMRLILRRIEALEKEAGVGSLPAGRQKRKGPRREPHRDRSSE